MKDEGMGSMIPIKIAEERLFQYFGKGGTQANLALRKFWHLGFVKTAKPLLP
jgi:hypothetical protein